MIRFFITYTEYDPDATPEQAFFNAGVALQI